MGIWYRSRWNNIVEVNCPTSECDGTISLEYEVEEPDREVGSRGGVSLLGLDCVNGSCECDHPVLPEGDIEDLFKVFGTDQIGRWEDDALDDLIERGSAG